MRKIGLSFVFTFLFILVSAYAYADKVYNTDVVVIGAGAGGMTAGVAALEKGMKVIILEKMPGIGGSGNYMEGTFAVGSDMQIRENIGINPEKQFKTVMNFHHWRIDPDVLNAWLKQTPYTIRWLEQHGIHFEKVTTAFIDGNRTWHMFEGGHGSSLIKAFAQQIKDNGGTILTETPAKQLIIKNGTVVGVIAENADGEKVTVNAKAVIVATGGFPCNKEMIKKYLPYAGYQYAGAAGREGDGIRMMEAAGAKLVNMNVVMQAGLWLQGVSTDQQFHRGAKYVKMIAALNQPYLFTSLQGNRVVDETQSLEYISNAFEGVGGEGFAVFDENTKKLWENTGLIRGYFGVVERMEKIENFDSMLADGIKQGWAFKANSLNELAKMTGMDPEVLKATAANMNKMTEAKYDSQFYKDPKWLRAVDKAPYYALKGSLRMYSTTGGAKVNSNFQVINTNGKAIPGLFAIGQDAGGLYSDSYDMHIAEGTASSWAINGGRLSISYIADNYK
ncbi:FAD-dependent oxidoreductase [Seleniivibrio sp.]|uniref:FAD-dependent oxidoreductase n=1 Tax=Seleniivibrio sp. TaxID=2898801 RepID=UPI0025D6CFEF|nr:FAD-dependent oxidoreductase [Seleniivibrio sp.]MCD8554823.1 FAD-binding protein [Seleniivibrio sp.]